MSSNRYAVGLSQKMQFVEGGGVSTSRERSLRRCWVGVAPPPSGIQKKRKYFDFQFSAGDSERPFFFLSSFQSSILIIHYSQGLTSKLR